MNYAKQDAVQLFDLLLTQPDECSGAILKNNLLNNRDLRQHCKDRKNRVAAFESAQKVDTPNEAFERYSLLILDALEMKSKIDTTDTNAANRAKFETYLRDGTFEYAGKNRNFIQRKKKAAKSVLTSSAAAVKKKFSIKTSKDLDGEARERVPKDLFRLASLFSALYDSLNALVHRNKSWDAFFGKTHTTSTNAMIKRLRVNAMSRLSSEVDAFSTNEKKLTHLKAARKMAIFNMHRSNYWFYGAFGRTRAVKHIDQALKTLNKGRYNAEILTSYNTLKK